MVLKADKNGLQTDKTVKPLDQLRHIFHVHVGLDFETDTLLLQELAEKPHVVVPELGGLEDAQ